jgi:hypothetical protein
VFVSVRTPSVHVVELVQEDGFGLKHLVATREAEQRGKRVSSCEERDDEDGENGLAELELWVFRIQPRQDQVSASEVSNCFFPS